MRTANQTVNHLPQRCFQMEFQTVLRRLTYGSKVSDGHVIIEPTALILVSSLHHSKMFLEKQTKNLIITFQFQHSVIKMWGLTLSPDMYPWRRHQFHMIHSP